MQFSSLHCIAESGLPGRAITELARRLNCSPEKRGRAEDRESSGVGGVGGKRGGGRQGDISGQALLPATTKNAAK